MQHPRAQDVIVIISGTARAGVSSAYIMLAGQSRLRVSWQTTGVARKPLASGSRQAINYGLRIRTTLEAKLPSLTRQSRLEICAQTPVPHMPTVSGSLHPGAQTGSPSAQHSCQQHRALQRRPRRKGSHAAHGAPQARSCRQRVPELWKLQTQLLPTFPHFVEASALELRLGQGLFSRCARRR